MTAPECRLVMGVPTYSAEEPGDWTGIIDAAVAMDRAGVDRVVVPDHVVFGERLEQYGDPAVGGRIGGQQPTGPDGHWLESLTTLAVIAGRTSRIRLGTNILIAALRRPVVLAKTLATLDVLSGGRVDLGVGVSWQQEEYEAAGLDFSIRGRLLDETLKICQTLWRDTPSSFHSERLHFERIHMMPKPRQPGGIPVWVSGSINRGVVRRLARFGTGWIPWGVTGDEMGPAIEQMKKELKQHRRDPSALRVLAEVPAGDLNLVPDWAEFGVTDFRVNPSFVAGPPAESDIREMVVGFRAAVGRLPLQDPASSPSM